MFVDIKTSLKEPTLHNGVYMKTYIVINILIPWLSTLIHLKLTLHL